MHRSSAERHITFCTNEENILQGGIEPDTAHCLVGFGTKGFQIGLLALEFLQYLEAT